MDNETARLEHTVLEAVREGLTGEELYHTVLARLHPDLARRPPNEILSALRELEPRIARLLADYQSWVANRKRHREWVYKISTENKP